MKAFLVARVSTLDQADALPGQIYRLEQYAQAKGYDYDLFQIKESAYSKKRVDFSKVIEKVITYADPCIVVFDKIDRYTRNSNSNEVTILNSLCREGKVELHFPSDNLYINKKSSSQEHLMLNIGIASSQYYSDSIRDNVNRRKEQKLRDGEIISRAPFGYRNTRDIYGKSTVVVERFEAAIVKDIFKKYGTGTTSLRELKSYITKRYGVTIRISKLEWILKNHFYYGKMLVGGTLYRHKYMAVITEAQFKDVKKVREGYKVKPTRWAGLPYRYRGLINCAECGCRITFETKKKQYVYGHCTQSKGKHDASYVAERKIEAQLASVLALVQLPDAAYEYVSEALNLEHVALVKDTTNKLAALDAQIERYKTLSERVYEDHIEERISYELYEKKFNDYTQKVKTLNTSRQNFEIVEKNGFITTSHLLRTANNISSLFKKANNEQTRSLINLVLSNLELDGDQLRWKYKKPFDLMAFCNKNATWQG